GRPGKKEGEEVKTRAHDEGLVNDDDKTIPVLVDEEENEGPIEPPKRIRGTGGLGSTGI
ncbi:hypothetical protein BOX15_Mlig015379g4, partial [Macrostomum lignano]